MADLAVQEIKQEPKSVKDKVTIVEQIYFQSHNEQPIQINHPPCVLELETKEQPYIRKIVVGEDWQPLDLGWIKECGLLQIFNEEGLFLQTQPSLQEKSEAAKKILELGFGDLDDEDAPKTAKLAPPTSFLPKILFPPRFGSKLILSDARALFVRSQSGSIRATLTALAK